MNKQALFLAISTASLSGIVMASDNAVGTPLDQTRAGVMGHVIVMATKLPRQQADIAGTVSVISAEELEQQVANDLDDLVRYQPGISMDTAGRGGNQGFIIRGE
tara:strand:+ start:1160 stop:1471 length:312 start_codon:yes stop_codon:yes gene_type:complete